MDCNRNLFLCEYEEVNNNHKDNDDTVPTLRRGYRLIVVGEKQTQNTKSKIGLAYCTAEYQTPICPKCQTCMYMLIQLNSLELKEQNEWFQFDGLLQFWVCDNTDDQTLLHRVLPLEGGVIVETTLTDINEVDYVFLFEEYMEYLGGGCGLEYVISEKENLAQRDHEFLRLDDPKLTIYFNSTTCSFATNRRF